MANYVIFSCLSSRSKYGRFVLPTVFCTLKCYPLKCLFVSNLASTETSKCKIITVTHTHTHSHTHAHTHTHTHSHTHSHTLTHTHTQTHTHTLTLSHSHTHTHTMLKPENHVKISTMATVINIIHSWHKRGQKHHTPPSIQYINIAVTQ